MIKQWFSKTTTLKRTITIFVLASLVISGPIAIAHSIWSPSKTAVTTKTSNRSKTTTTTAKETRKTIASLKAQFPTLSPGSLYSASIAAENRKPGTTSWRITGNPIPGQIEGFASSTFARVGDTLPFYISTISPSYSIVAYRMGWYQGNLARLIWKSGTLPGHLQPQCPILAPTNTVECSNWSQSIKIHISKAFIPGDYLFKLIASNGQQQYIPLTVVDPTSNGAIVVINAVSTWQAYNNYGGYSLYHGPNGANATRATKVSFDRPYAFDFGLGGGDFLGNELPLVAFAEKLGLNVTYVNSVYLQMHPSLILNHNAAVSLGHDEYYSVTMRDALQNGVNNGRSILFLGANAIFRRIRFEPSPMGQDRIEVNYRNPYQDPLFGKNNARVTANWPAFPDANNESSLIGLQYECNPVNAPLVVTDPSSWIFSGTNAYLGFKVPSLVGPEFDQYIPYSPHPSNLQILAHSPLLCRNVPYFSDMSYYSTPTGGGVFATGTNYWVVSLMGGCPSFTGPCPDPFTQTVTANVLKAFGSGGVGIIHPSIPNANSIYYNPPFPALTPVPPIISAPTTTKPPTPCSTGPKSQVTSTTSGSKTTSSTTTTLCPTATTSPSATSTTTATVTPG
ncbi:N,N-dimethylformamidase beta subunit family domain-containing protein [Acidithrix ferrooxidans]|uniref:N,N-dimethylformamidase beta subunit-like C-terminal domain-containing protein n=1 Tax=Acidithrix ferrooxidans TaxID=1280514 RepID=A0A0D8HIT4_9ACTN|nr:N,N-dimethylformamidase beta subunit family domain-containing protein [Acidithrix ferrooxidans]KJF16991.1 hypothetical protein AXFE_21260 [Acidithrix ferrooxidans]